MAGATENRTLAAAVSIFGYAALIGFTDNFVRIIAAEAGLWQFHAIRTLMVLCLVALVAVPFKISLRPKQFKAVALRSAIQGTALMAYFGCLAFMTVPQAAAGLFTAPIFVLLISRFWFGHALGPVRIGAVIAGFAGVLLVLEPGANAPIGWASLFAVFAGAFYALGNVVLREWCPDETAPTLTLGFFIALGIGGVGGLIVTGLLDPEVPEGTAGFVLRGWVWPSTTFLWWTFVQAIGSILGVGLCVRGYQLAEASRVSIFEYIVLPVTAFWSFVLWGETISALGVVGMLLIVLAGVVIILRGK